MINIFLKFFNAFNLPLEPLHFVISTTHDPSQYPHSLLDPRLAPLLLPLQFLQPVRQIPHHTIHHIQLTIILRSKFRHFPIDVATQRGLLQHRVKVHNIDFLVEDIVDGA
jgi:hypothetical protein